MNQQSLFAPEPCQHCAYARKSMAAFARTVEVQAAELDRLRARVLELEGQRAQVPGPRVRNLAVICAC